MRSERGFFYDFVCDMCDRLLFLLDGTDAAPSDFLALLLGL